MAELEIERKFLVKKIPEELDIVDAVDIQQGYIFSNKEIELRIRIKNDSFFHTIKSSLPGGLQRTANPALRPRDPKSCFFPMPTRPHSTSATARTNALKSASRSFP